MTRTWPVSGRRGRFMQMLRQFRRFYENLKALPAIIEMSERRVKTSRRNRIGKVGCWTAQWKCNLDVVVVVVVVVVGDQWAEMKRKWPPLKSTETTITTGILFRILELKKNKQKKNQFEMKDSFLKRFFFPPVEVKWDADAGVALTRRWKTRNRRKEKPAE